MSRTKAVKAKPLNHARAKRELGKASKLVDEAAELLTRAQVQFGNLYWLIQRDLRTKQHRQPSSLKNDRPTRPTKRRG